MTARALLPLMALLAAGPALAESGLPLRTDSVIGWSEILRIVGSLILLLGITSALLWLYQRRFGRLPPGFSSREAELDCVARLRLSPRTQVFVVRRGTQEFLVTESAGGATVTAIAPGSHAAGNAGVKGTP